MARFPTRRNKLLRRIVIILLLWLTYQFFSGLWVIWKLYRTQRGLEADISRFRALEVYYRTQRKIYRDPYWIDYIAREKLGMVRPRERYIRILPK